MLEAVVVVPWLMVGGGGGDVARHVLGVVVVAVKLYVVNKFKFKCYFLKETRKTCQQKKEVVVVIGWWFTRSRSGQCSSLHRNDEHDVR